MIIRSTTEIIAAALAGIVGASNGKLTRDDAKRLANTVPDNAVSAASKTAGADGKPIWFAFDPAELASVFAASANNVASNGTERSIVLRNGSHLRIVGGSNDFGTAPVRVTAAHNLAGILREHATTKPESKTERRTKNAKSADPVLAAVAAVSETLDPSSDGSDN